MRDRICRKCKVKKSSRAYRLVMACQTPSVCYATTYHTCRECCERMREELRVTMRANAPKLRAALFAWKEKNAIR